VGNPCTILALLRHHLLIPAPNFRANLTGTRHPDRAQLGYAHHVPWELVPSIHRSRLPGT
jgi:hypothetical protein